MNDGSEQDRLERALRETDALFELVTESAPVMVWKAGPDGLRTFFSNSWLAFTGRSLEQELGTGWSEGLLTADWDRCLQVYQEALSTQLDASDHPSRLH